MIKYQIVKKLKLAISIEQAWAYFSNPSNLSEITPPWLKLTMTCELPDSTYAGMILSYKIYPILSFPIHWVTEITHVNQPNLFVDEQRSGPYKMWHHQHHFRSIPGGVEIQDIVDYIMPFGPLGVLAHSLFVRKQIAEIFDHRATILSKRFGILSESDVE